MESAGVNIGAAVWCSATLPRIMISLHDPFSPSRKTSACVPSALKWNHDQDP